MASSVPRVKRFAVVYDDDDDLDKLPLFQPSASIGLTQAICTAVANYLEGKSDEDMRRNALVRKLQNIRCAIAGHDG